MIEFIQAPAPRDIAIRVAQFVEENYGDKADVDQACEGLWLAMQMLAGPQKAASVLRYCGVNFASK